MRLLQVADLVALGRLGLSYSSSELATALEKRALVELRALIRPSEDVSLNRAEMGEWLGAGSCLSGKS